MKYCEGTRYIHLFKSPNKNHLLTTYKAQDNALNNSQFILPKKVKANLFIGVILLKNKSQIIPEG